MPQIDMPEGTYLSVAGQIHPDTGGQTRALLLRNRLLARYTDVEPLLLSFDDTPHYPRIREVLREQGQLVGSMRLLNAFEWYRDDVVDDLTPTGDALPVIEGLDQEDVPHPDGSVYLTRHVTRYGADPVILDYRRPDGSVYLRVPAGGSATVSRLTKVYLVNSKGEPVGAWPSQRGWRKEWILRLLEPDRRAFLICDSRFAIADLIGVRDPRLHVVHVVHNMHLRSPYHVNSPLSPSYQPLFDGMQDLDGLVTLTERQGQDIAERFGATDNLYVASHPVDTPDQPDPRPARDPMRFVVLARLERQKRLEDCIRAFALVLKEEPDARLDIYGNGSLRERLTTEIEKLGVGRAVRLRGHDRDAKNQLWSANGMLVTSRFEGYSLAILEARSRGCPVVTYDVKYGPREQITDGEDGFLVRSGDLRGLADGVLRLIREPDLAARMSAAALDNSSRQQGHLKLLEDWRGVLEQVIDRRRRRTRLTSVELDVSRLGFRRRGRLPDRYARGALRRLGGRRSTSAGFRAAPPVEFAGRLTVSGGSETSTLADALLTLDAVDRATGARVPLPLTVQRSGKVFRLSSSFVLREVFDALEGAGTEAAEVTLRLRLIWHNSHWETMLARPRRLAPGYELSYAGDGELSLLRGQ